MDKLLPFLHEYWLLATAFIVVLLAYLILEFVFRNKGAKALSPQTLTLQMKQKGCQLIDVRDNDQYRNGHIVNSVNYSLEQLGQAPKALQKHKANPIVIICNSGHWAQQAAAMLRKQGFEQLFTLQGGLATWKKEQMPLVKAKGAAE